MIRIFISFFIILILYFQGNSQTCTTLGQNPSTAFPVCGTAIFRQDTVPYCGNKGLVGPCSADGIADVNPFWYRFTCYKAGTLGFFITPNDLNDDYDWELFDITGHDANEVYTNASLFVACNWSGNTGRTGASAAGTSLQNCAGTGYPTFSAMPTLKIGHNYLLLLSHFTRYTPSQNGYELSFGGGTASITDTLFPALSSAKSSCDATRILVKLNKKMKCSSLAADGSDFTITPSAGGITGATGIGCNTGFDLDSISLTISNPLPAGNYNITINKGTDGNSLLDNCDRGITPGSNLTLEILPLQPTPMDSLTSVKCAPASLQLAFKNNIRCNSIAADGSDFVVTGPAPVTVIRAEGNCLDEVANVINVILSTPIVNGGNYKITLKRGIDGNTLIDDCAQETPVGSALPFTTRDTVSAEFSYTTLGGCKTDTLLFSHSGGSNGVNQWLWKLDHYGSSNLQAPVAYFNSLGSKEITLSVSNGLCNDTSTQVIPGGNALIADFETTNLLCPEDPATFINNSTGAISRYSWDFGNGTTNLSRTPPPLQYPALANERIYPVRLIIASDAGCLDTAVSTIKVLKSCYIAVPNAFTPNGDGLNDYLYPTNAYKADDLEFRVFNRLGQQVFYSSNREQKWNGKVKEYPQDSGVYVWTLKYTHHDTAKKVFQKGSTVLIR